MKLFLTVIFAVLALGFADISTDEEPIASKTYHPSKYGSKIDVGTFPYAQYTKSLSKSSEAASPPLRRIQPYGTRMTESNPNGNVQYVNNGFSTSYTTTQNGDSAPFTTYTNSKYQSSNANPNGVRYTSSGSMYGRHPMEAYNQAMIDHNMRMSMDMIPRSINIPMPVMVPVPMHIPMPFMNVPQTPTHYDSQSGRPCLNFQKSCVNGRCVASCNGEAYSSYEDTDDK